MLFCGGGQPIWIMHATGSGTGASARQARLWISLPFAQQWFAATTLDWTPVFCWSWQKLCCADWAVDAQSTCTGGWIYQSSTIEVDLPYSIWMYSPTWMMSAQPLGISSFAAFWLNISGSWMNHRIAWSPSLEGIIRLWVRPPFRVTDERPEGNVIQEPSWIPRAVSVKILFSLRESRERRGL